MIITFHIVRRENKDWSQDFTMREWQTAGIRVKSVPASKLQSRHCRLSCFSIGCPFFLQPSEVQLCWVFFSILPITHKVGKGITSRYVPTLCRYSKDQWWYCPIYWYMYVPDIWVIYVLYRLVNDTSVLWGPNIHRCL